MAGKPHLTLEQLREFNGEDESKPVLLAIRGKIYDVSKGRDFYGRGGPYNVFAGKECSRALALMRVTEDECSGDLTGLDQKQLDVLADWEAKLAGKYGIVGEVQNTDSIAPADVAMHIDGQHQDDVPTPASSQGLVLSVADAKSVTY